MNWQDRRDRIQSEANGDELLTSLVDIAHGCRDGPNAAMLSLGSSVWHLKKPSLQDAIEHVFGCGHRCYLGCFRCKASFHANQRAIEEHAIRQQQRADFETRNAHLFLRVS